MVIPEYEIMRLQVPSTLLKFYTCSEHRNETVKGTQQKDTNVDFFTYTASPNPLFGRRQAPARVPGPRANRS